MRSSSLADLRHHAVPVLATLRKRCDRTAAPPCAGACGPAVRMYLVGWACWRGVAYAPHSPKDGVRLEPRTLQHRSRRLLHIEHCMLCSLSRSA